MGPLPALFLALSAATSLSCAEGQKTGDVQDLAEFEGDQSELVETSDLVDIPADEVDQAELVEPLALYAVVPPQGSIDGGTVVTLRGKGFAPGVRVLFGSTEASPVAFVDAAQLTLSTPPALSPGSSRVVLENPDGARFELADAFVYLPKDTPSIDDCTLLQLGPFDVLVDAPLTLSAVVYVRGLTDAVGQGPGLIGEIGWGSDAQSPTDYRFSPLGYTNDVDRQPGDKANDQYAGLLSVPVAGAFRSIARFRFEGQSEHWIYCDGDGQANGIQLEQLGRVNVSEPFRPQIGRCELEQQGSLSVLVGELSPEIRAVVHAQGVTDAAGRGAGLIGELGFGVGSEPNAYQFKATNYLDDINGGQDDRYSARLLIEEPGSYHYAARFALQSAPNDWLYCLLPSERLGDIEVNPAPQPFISFCSTESLLSSTTTGVLSGEILGLVQVAGVTTGLGQGAGIVAQLRWGEAGGSPSTWTSVETASYKNDADGASAGDRARDRYRARITPGSAGSYSFAYRFRLNEGPWMDCDTNGTTPSSAFEPNLLGSLVVTEQVVATADWCSMHAPVIGDTSSAGVVPGDVYYGRVREEGVTDVSDGSGVISAELMLGPMGLDPRSNPLQFQAIPAIHNAAVAGQIYDEYMAAAPSAGEFAAFYRFSVDGGLHWLFCDIDGSSDIEPFSTSAAAVARVTSPGQPVDTIDYCRVWQSSLDVGSSDPPPIVTVEVYESSITQGGNGSNANLLLVEFGYGALSTNPALSANPALAGQYQWRSAPFARIANANNYEYETSPYAVGSTPPVGRYGVVARARRSDTSRWTYCDTDPGTMVFQMSKLSTLDIR